MLHCDGVEGVFSVVQGRPGISSADAISNQVVVTLEPADSHLRGAAELPVRTVRRQTVSALDQFCLHQCDVFAGGSPAQCGLVRGRHGSAQSARDCPVRDLLRDRFLLHAAGTMDHHPAANIESDVVHGLAIARLPEDAAELLRQVRPGALPFPVAGAVPHAGGTASGERDPDPAADVLHEALAVVAQGPHVVRVIDAPAAALPGSVQRLAAGNDHALLAFRADVPACIVLPARGVALRSDSAPHIGPAQAGLSCVPDNEGFVLPLRDPRVDQGFDIRCGFHSHHFLFCLSSS